MIFGSHFAGRGEAYGNDLWSLDLKAMKLGRDLGLRSLGSFRKVIFRGFKTTTQEVDPG